MQPERGREQRIVERHEFQAIGVVGPRSGKRTVIARLTRQIALDGKRERAGKEEARNRHERLESFGPLLPQVTVRLFVCLQ